MNKETIKYLITEFHEKPLPKVIYRQYNLPTDSGKIISLVGIRRSGKTFLLFQTIDELLARGIAKENILYLNFEDDRLFPVHLQDLDLILSAYHEMYPDKLDERKYLFFDEIQNIPKWESYCRRIYDQENISLFLSGSSSQFLAKEIATALRGRTISYEIFPLCFSEFLDFEGITVKPYSERSRAAVENAFDRFVTIGGFPEVVMASGDIRSKILQEYADLLLYKDLLEQYDIKNQFLFKYLLKYIFSNPGSLLSTNKLYHDFKSMGLSLSKNTLYEYLEYLQYAYICFTTSKFDRSIRKQVQNPRKLYVIDTGLISRFVVHPLTNIGHKLENIIFLYLRQQNSRISYYHNGVDIDFVNEHARGIDFINVCYQAGQQKTWEREIKSLVKIHELYPQACKILLVRGEKPPFAIPDFIEFKDVVQFLLEEATNGSTNGVHE